MDGNMPSSNERLKISQRGMERTYLWLKRKVPCSITAYLWILHFAASQDMA